MFVKNLQGTEQNLAKVRISQFASLPIFQGNCVIYSIKTTNSELKFTRIR